MSNCERDELVPDKGLLLDEDHLWRAFLEDPEGMGTGRADNTKGEGDPYPIEKR